MKLIRYLKFKKPIINVGFFIMLTITLISCGADDDPTVMDVDYLPIEVGNSWTFTQQGDFPDPDSGPNNFTELQGTISITGITTLSNGTTAFVATADVVGTTDQGVSDNVEIKGYLAQTADDLLLLHSAIDDLQGELFYMPSIKVGTKWEGERGRTAEVVAQETVKVPSGVFDNCFRINTDLNGLRYAIWLANDVGPVKIEVSAFEHYITSTFFSPDGQTLAGVDSNDTVYLWDMATRKNINTLTGITGYSRGFVFIDEQTIASKEYIDAVYTVYLWDVATGKNINTFTAPTGLFSIDHISLSPDGQTIAVIGAGTVSLWNMATGKNINTHKKSYADIRGVVFSPDGQTLASWGSHPSWFDSGSDVIYLWDVATGVRINTLTIYEDFLISVVFSPDGQTLASGGSHEFWYDSESASIYLWDVTTGNNIKIPTGHTGAIGSVVFSPDGQTLASTCNYASCDHWVSLWDVATGKNINTLKRMEGHSLESVSFNPDGQALASFSKDNRVFLWDIVTGQLLYTLEAPILEVIAGTAVLEKYNFR